MLVLQAQCTNRLLHLTRNLYRSLSVGAGKYDGKLFPTVSRHQVTGPTSRLRHRLGNAAQAKVSGNMTIVIIVFLETVDIHENQRKLFLAPLASPPLLLQGNIEAATIGYTGEAVDVGEPHEKIVLSLEFEMSLHPGFDDRESKRFSDVIYRPQLQPCRLIFRGIESGNKNDRYVSSEFIRLELATNLITVHTWHDDIQQHHIYMLGPGRLQRLFSVTCHENLVALHERLTENLNVLRNVVYNEKGGRRVRLRFKVFHSRFVRQIRENTWQGGKLLKNREETSLLKVPGYDQVKQLHQGARYITFSARCENSGKGVVLKTTLSDNPGHEEVDRLHQEFQILTALKGSAAVTPLEHRMVDDRPVLVLEKLNGSPIRDIGLVPTEEFLKLALLVLEAVTSIHQKGFTHQRLDLESLLVSPDRRQIRLLHCDRAGVDNFRRDIVSLGSVFYQVLTGRSTSASESQPPHLLSAAVPENVSLLVMRMMEDTPENGYQNCSEVRAAVSLCLSQMQRPLELLLAEAQAARTGGHEFEAVRLYEKAIEVAQWSGDARKETLAFQAAAEFYQDMELPHLASHHFAQAQACRERSRHMFGNLQDADQKLKLREKQLLQFLEAVPLGIFVIDRQGNPYYANSEAEKILGSVGVRTQSGRLAESIPFHEIFQGRAVKTENLEMEVDGRQRRLAVTGTPILDDSGKVVYGVAVLEDITEHKAAQALLEDYSQTLKAEVEERTREVQLSKAAAEAANEAKSTFLANMSHEVRTPLNAVLGLTSLALRSGPSARMTDYLKKIQFCSHSLLHIINDILDLSRIEAGKMKIDTLDFDLRQLLEALNNVVGDEAHHKGLEFLVTLDPDVPRSLRGDSYRITQILTNLVYNAVKFTHHGTIMVRASLEAADPKPTVRLSVSDTGIGIEPSALPALFESFSQVDTSSTRQYGGAGLGLAISKNLVNLMDGKLNASSLPGQGSTFYFTLQLERQDQQTEEPVMPPEYQNRRILVVDDNPLAAKVTADMLRSMNLQPVTVDSADRALEAVRNDDYSLVLMDLKMPEVNGVEAACSMDELSEIPSLLMATSHDLNELGDITEKTPLRGVLQKPVCRADLFRAILLGFGAPAGAETQELDEWEMNGRLKGLRVLVAEDIPLNRQIMRDILELAGVEVVLVENGRQAVEAVLNQGVVNSSFHAVLMDVQMPVMDGFEATRLLRELGYDTLPIIAITARAMEGDLELCMRAGMNAHVTKPISVQAFLRILATQTLSDMKEAPAVVRGESLTGELPEGAELERLRPHLVSFANNYRGIADEIESALGEGGSAFEPLHKLIGVAGNLRLGSLHRAATELQQAAREKRDTKLLLTVLQSALKRSFQAIDEVRKPQIRRPVTAEELARLEQLLAQRDFTASTYFDAIHPEVEGLEHLLEPMSQLDFETALERLRAGKT